MKPVSQHSQRGVALIVGMVVLIVLALIGVSSLKVSSLEERMAGNSLDRSFGFYAAESALREAEEVLDSGVLAPFNGTGGMYEPVDWTAAPVWEDNAFTDDSSVRYGGALNGATAHYIIEKMPTGAEEKTLETIATDVGKAQSGIYRVTAVGRGPTGSSYVMLQTVFER
jgi:type IV pilus assembly protein PilX